MLTKIFTKIMNYQLSKCYDDIHKNGFRHTDGRLIEYNSKEGSEFKLRYIMRYVNDQSGPILDVGCGKGHYLREILKTGKDAIGIDFSKTVCQKFLKDVPHVCSDIIDYADNSNIIYNGCICCDVLEHIPHKRLNNTIRSLRKLSPSIFFGIANHNEFLNGKNLHLIRENIKWWSDLLKQYYKIVSVIIPSDNDKLMLSFFEQQRFFFIHCEAFKKKQIL